MAYDLTIPWFDNHIPVISWFVIFYMFAYPFWLFGPMMVAKTNARRFTNYVVAAIIGYLIGGVLFVVFPTTNMRPVIENKTVFDWLLNFIYQNDSPARPINLFPSYHCMISWFCYLGVAGRKEISKRYRIFALISALFICISTQFVKQHYIVDMIGGILIATIVFFVCQKWNWGRILDRFYQKAFQK